MGDFFEIAGLTQLITLDMHSKQAEGLIGVPVIHIGGSTLYTDYLKNHIGIDLGNLIISSGDVGGAERAKKFAQKLDTGYVLVDKTRPKAGEVGTMTLIGDVTGKDVIIVDDMTDTGGTIIAATELLYEKGAQNVYACITHLLYKSKAIEKLGTSSLKKVFVTNSFTHEKLPDNFEVIDLKEKLAEIITDILEKNPVKV
jgi:ribose-phosphate pyrophosphokinase